MLLYDQWVTEKDHMGKCKHPRLKAKQKTKLVVSIYEIQQREV